jgi:hypothetical protein
MGQSGHVLPMVIFDHHSVKNRPAKINTEYGISTFRQEDWNVRVLGEKECVLEAGWNA